MRSFLIVVAILLGAMMLRPANAKADADAQQDTVSAIQARYSACLNASNSDVNSIKTCLDQRTLDLAKIGIAASATAPGANKLAWPNRPANLDLLCTEDYAQGRTREIQAANDIGEILKSTLIAEDAGTREDVCFRQYGLPLNALYKGAFYSLAAIGRNAYGPHIKVATLTLSAGSALAEVDRYDIPAGYRAIYDWARANEAALYKIMKQ